ncbi:hypothetical protein EH223_05720 [candidate division KSB1 bacterium]|nr:GTP-binding protein [candidate division KSB1 bacterium]RQW05100.1 MAG: hypothetical protein EH223_05720 [candidate division KSB1 bacterium]
MSTPLTIITGFLGSGKTTFLKRVIDRYADIKKIGIIQNEFAPMNVDALELRRTGKTFDVLEINRGSVFCVCLIADFQSDLRAFIDEHHPDVVFLEASGLSDPIAVVEILQAPVLKDRVHLAKICTIVDASSFLLLQQANQRLTNQVRVADVVIVNKQDKAEAKAKLEEVVSEIRRINPLACIIPASYCDVDMNVFESEVQPVALEKRSALAAYKSPGRPAIGTAVVKSTRKISRTALDLFLAEQLPKSYRLKGHVQLDDATALMLQSTLGDLHLVPLENYIGPSEIIAIGPEIHPQNFSRRFRELATS